MWSASPDHPVDPGEILPVDIAVEEGKGTERMVLDGCADSTAYCQVGKEGLEFNLAQFEWMSIRMAGDETADPADIGPFRQGAVVARGDGSADLLQ